MARNDQAEGIKLNKFDLVTAKFGETRCMTVEKAKIMKSLIEGNEARNILEIGFLHGKGSAYIGAILEDRGGVGKLITIDKENARQREPNIGQMLSDLNLAHRVEPIFAHRSYTWELQKMIAQKNPPQFDLCYFDGGHDWDTTALGVLLVGFLMKPGGIIVLEDLWWSISGSPHYKANPKAASKYSEDEKNAESVRLVWDLVLPRIGFSQVREYRKVWWGVARKVSATENLQGLSWWKRNLVSRV